ncbi:MAG: zinc-binding alcohol dehydrogenase family protein [Candidatus Hydrogenedentota bacterium]
MLAFCIDKPDHSHIIEIDPPGDLAPEEVMLNIKTMGICGTDLSSYRGVNPLVSYPRVPGHEISATIEALGSDVPDTFKIGDTVTVYPYTSCGKCGACRNGRNQACEFNATLGVQREGAFTERFAQPWQKLIPADGLSYAETALIEPMAVGFHAVERGEVTHTDTVVVIGCGAIGLSVITGAVARGAKVVAVDIDDHKLDVANEIGAVELINSADTDLVKRVMELTADVGADVVVEAVGLPITFTAAIDAVCYTGRVVYIGYAKEHVSYDTALFVKKELNIRGSRNATHENFEDVIRTLRETNLPIDKIISKTVPLAEAPAAIDHWDKKGRDLIKIHVTIND